MSGCAPDDLDSRAGRQELRLWYLHTHQMALRPIGVTATQVIERVRVLSELCDVHFISIEGEPLERDWTEVFPEPTIDSVTVSSAGFGGHVCSLLSPTSSVVRAIIGRITSLPSGPTEILHCRSHWATLVGISVAQALRRHRRKAALLYDMEGLAAEESRYAARSFGTGPLKAWPKQWGLRLIEQRGMRHADHVICVSENMKAYVVEEYAAPPSRISVVQSTADAELFYHDPDAGRAARAELDISHDAPVIMYNGSFAPYQRPDLFLDFFAEVLRVQPEAVLLILSRQEERARELVAEAGLPCESVRISSSPYDQMQRYLNAADWGLCLRDDDILNQAASPTKVAEYLCCGTPVVITPGTGDYGLVVPRQDLGVVVEPGDWSKAAIDTVSSPVSVERRTHCAKWAAANLTHQAALTTYRMAYDEMVTRGRP